ncbi:MAG: hypothetical protein LGR52_01825 [Candidatus Thiosymbion ectosymbiont of Robbea hypermnestra]|nr:hypothetical protein [Candidatus Thiosymbion ectosymbiont of Robbea hypermnestra]
MREGLEVLFPCLERALVDADQLAGLRALAARLAPVPQGGFECRLGPDPRVDLHQCLYPTDGESGLLRDGPLAIDAADDTVAQSNRASLGDFLAEWFDPSSQLHGCASQIWLEYDNRALSVGSLPSVFANLLQRPSLSADTYYRHAVLFLDRLLGSARHFYKDGLHACYAQCPAGAFIGHIGVMLSRSARVLRVNVKQLSPDSLIPYLQGLGWRGDAEELRALMRELHGFFDEITVCLDMGRELRLRPRIGFECVVPKRLPKGEPWGLFLDYLVEKGLCAPGKREAVLGWPGRTTPMNAEAPWPDYLIAASLLKPRDCFTLFNRRLAYIKVVWQPGALPEAKAYLWYRHKWSSKA